MRNPLYQIASLRGYARAIGWPAAAGLRLSDLKVRLGLQSQDVLRFKLKNSNHPVLMRPHSSDRDVLWQVFIQGEYEMVRLSNPNTIIDLGANAGYSAAYFLSKYPGAEVLAVEPDPGNYGICCRNLAAYGERVKVIHGAAWSEDTNLMLEKGTYMDGRDWATRVVPIADGERSDRNSSTEVRGYDVTSLIRLCKTQEIDLVKIDIEGSELELFGRNSEEWLPRVKNLCIELHDAECRETFFRAISGFTYSLVQTEGLAVCYGLQRRA